MSSVQHIQPISIRDYLDGEKRSRHKHEYVEGTVYAMVGAFNAHNRIANNVTLALGRQLLGRPCQIFNSDTKIRIRHAGGTRFYYPDVSVGCAANPLTDSFQDSPVVIVEVVSPSTRRVDEYEKKEAYLSIDSLCIYILLEQSSASALVYRRAVNGFTCQRYVGLEASIDLPEIQSSLSLPEAYRSVEFIPEVDEDEGDYP